MAAIRLIGASLGALVALVWMFTLALLNEEIGVRHESAAEAGTSVASVRAPLHAASPARPGEARRQRPAMLSPTGTAPLDASVARRQVSPPRMPEEQIAPDALPLEDLPPP
jgi:hypothetical protein